eukprot:GILJ01002278.1.p1 GENE.GILJ01002278.1~~GILJ01002278.1.p1  ORF type:complete len:285 (-),score=42.55 GILJ01002278.1:199-1053(-)
MELMVAGNIKLHTYRYPVPSHHAVKGIVFMWHGWNEHAGRSAHMAQAFAENGFVTLSLDFRGHGKSGGTRGYISDMDVLVSDAHAYIERARIVYPSDLPLFCYGCSMGGLISVMLAIRYPDLFRGVLLGAPAIKAADDFEPFWQKIALCLGGCMPRVEVKKVEAAIASKNPNANESFWNDALCFTGKIRLGTGAAFLHSFEFIRRNRQRMKTPFILIQGGCDKFVSADASQEFFDAMDKSMDKEYVYMENLWHDLIHEPEHQQVIDKFVSWLSARTQVTLQQQQ